MLIAISTILILHVVGFLNAYVNQSDRFTDIIYSLSFVLIAGILLYQLENPTAVHYLLLAMISIWAIRLGLYLGYRIKVWGHDKRFDAFRGAWHRLIKFWILQFVSIFVIALPFLFAFSFENAQLNVISVVGSFIFLVGLTIETVADYQKFVFKQNTKGEKAFISSGLWSKTRHPNYLGEWLVWVGVFIFCAPFLFDWQWVAVLSPIWMYVLLRYISGGNLLETSAEQKYGDMPSYQTYKKNTGIFFPKF